MEKGQFYKVTDDAHIHQGEHGKYVYGEQDERVLLFYDHDGGRTWSTFPDDFIQIIDAIANIGKWNEQLEEMKIQGFLTGENTTYDQEMS
jgi:hypothetical protein